MPRISSVDAVRGLAMLCILSGPSVAYAIKALGDARGGVTEAVGRFAGKQFSHAPWAGLRFYDLLFPIFIFTVGVSIALSLAKPGVNEQRRAVYWRVVRRSSALFALGVIAYGGLPVEHWSDVRLMGVLQRIALCYLLTSLLFLHVGAPGLIGVTVFLLAGYWALLAFMTLPQAVGNPYGSEQNLAIWIDQQFLPGRKLFGNWDPEGLLSTLPAIATCLFGALTGMLLLAKALTPTQKSVATIVAGSMAVVAGELWGLQFPIIKNIWT
ncbi:MAG: DUF5009 domain-containing protein, partial [Alphaproteobacteria bacterium]|nr:DUF5009 domain-containing protein [Alphaproteobacteria bacterium]